MRLEHDKTGFSDNLERYAIAIQAQYEEEER